MGIIFIETHRGGQSILFFVSSTKAGLCLINHVLPKLAQSLALVLFNEPVSKPDGNWPCGYSYQFSQVCFPYWALSWRPVLA